MELQSRFAKRHPDDEFYDSVAIYTAPRYKTSGLSGDEWRFAAHVEIIRKGKVLCKRSYRNVETAAAALPWLLLTFGEDAEFSPPEDDHLCFNPGCREKAVSEYELKQEYSRQGEGPLPKSSCTLYRRFCERHLRRGDCAFEDADANYVVVSGPGPDQAKPMPTDEKPSIFGGVVGL